MDFTNDELLYLLGRKTAEVERLTAINQAQADEIQRLRAAKEEPTEPPKATKPAKE